MRDALNSAARSESEFLEVRIMRRFFLAVALLAAAGTAAVAGPAKTPVTGREASIPFAALGGIADWRANGDHGLWIRGRSHKWYYAELLGSCSGLGFHDRIGFVIEPYGRFDRFSSIVVEGRICPIKSLRESAPPRQQHAREQHARGPANQQRDRRSSVRPPVDLRRRRQGARGRP